MMCRKKDIVKAFAEAMAKEDVEDERAARIIKRVRASDSNGGEYEYPRELSEAEITPFV